MKIFITLLIAGPFLFQSSGSKTSSSIFARFDGRTPCQELVKAWSIPVDSDCAKLKWLISLYQDSITQAPTTYTIESTLNRTSPWKGKWAILRGTKANARAVVYQLKPDNSLKPSLLFLKGDDNVIFFLDKEKNLLIGNSDFSYTLNRTNKP